MTFAKPQYSNTAVNRAGEIIRDPSKNLEDNSWAHEVFVNWRASHSYPMNTFQATLRNKIKNIDKTCIVAERLKRMSSIYAKLQRFPTMKLSRMQDVGGLRAIVRGIKQVRMLEEKYRIAKFEHELKNSKDYIVNPKNDGYRGVHLIFKYKNKRAPEYDGLYVELQIRTRLQHSWATAVETMGTYLGQALKSGIGEEQWKNFFSLTSAAFAKQEGTSIVPGYEHLGVAELSIRLEKLERELDVLSKLRGFSIATNRITEGKGQGSYHLVILNSDEKTVQITPYPVRALEKANKDYSQVEKRAQSGEPVEAVLVSAGPIKALKKAYPNYFLDTHDFIKSVRKILNTAQNLPLLKQ